MWTVQENVSSAQVDFHTVMKYMEMNGCWSKEKGKVWYAQVIVHDLSFLNSFLVLPLSDLTYIMQQWFVFPWKFLYFPLNTQHQQQCFVWTNWREKLGNWHEQQSLRQGRQRKEFRCHSILNTDCHATSGKCHATGGTFLGLFLWNIINPPFVYNLLECL